MKVTLVVKSRFQFFHLARQLERKGLLNEIYSGYPKFKLKDENGIPQTKIKTYPWFVAPYMVRSHLGLNKFDWLNKKWEFKITNSLDNYVAKKIINPGILISMSASGLRCGAKMQELGGKHICQRGSSHIEYQNNILLEEYRKWGFEWKGIDRRKIDYELSEYEQADRITLPSEYAYQSFLKMGVPQSKLVKIPYGGRLDRFKKIGTPNQNKFSILWVGNISLGKGFMYALEAFKNFQHPNKEFIVIGSMSPEIKSILNSESIDNIFFKGNVPNIELAKYYNNAHVLLFSSIDDGFGIVMSEAMACGCPVIATPNTGAPDLITNNKNGFIVPIRNSNAIIESFQKLVDTPYLREEMSANALKKVQSLGGWDTYGTNFKALIDTLS